MPKSPKKLCSGKATGLDQVSVDFLKHGGPILVPLLTKLFHCIFNIFNSGCYPKDWQKP